MKSIMRSISDQNVSRHDFEETMTKSEIVFFFRAHAINSHQNLHHGELGRSLYFTIGLLSRSLSIKKGAKMDNCCGGMCARIHSCPSPSLCSPQVFILIEHPVEREKLAVAQELLKEQRANFLNLGRTDGRTLIFALSDSSRRRALYELQRQD